MGDCGTRSQSTTCPLPNYGISWWRMPLMLTPTTTGKGVSVPIAHHLPKGPPTPRAPSSSTPAPPRRLNPLNTGTTLSCKPSTSSPPPPQELPTTCLQNCRRTSMTPRGLVQTPPPITTDPWPRRNSPWSHHDDPYVPREWGGNGGLVADSVGADSYRGGNVTYPPTPASSTRQ